MAHKVHMVNGSSFTVDETVIYQMDRDIAESERIFIERALAQNPHFVKLFDVLKDKYGEPIGNGNTRVGFDTGRGFVVKMPLHTGGERDNLKEHHRFRRWRTQVDGIPLARCRAVSTKGVVVLVMEKVERVPYGRPEMPKWADYIDCQQVGYTRKGEIVAYDFA